jgi:hypothetical protein
VGWYSQGNGSGNGAAAEEAVAAEAEAAAAVPVEPRQETPTPLRTVVPTIVSSPASADRTPRREETIEMVTGADGGLDDIKSWAAKIAAEARASRGVQADSR